MVAFSNGLRTSLGNILLFENSDTFFSLFRNKVIYQTKISFNESFVEAK